jgi:outer membrane protein
MRKSLVGLLAALVIPSVAAAQAAGHMDTPWTVRAGALFILPTASASDALGAKVGSDFTAEIDISRKFTPIFAAELVLATAAHEVYVEDTDAGRVSLGSINILPPSLVLQAHLPTAGKVHPYIGAGVNWTIIYKQTGALAGLDYDIGSRGLFNADVKYVTLSTDVSSNGQQLDTVDVNPILIRIGFGYRF